MKNNDGNTAGKTWLTPLKEKKESTTDVKTIARLLALFRPVSQRCLTTGLLNRFMQMHEIFLDCGKQCICLNTDLQNAELSRRTDLEEQRSPQSSMSAWQTSDQQR